MLFEYLQRCTQKTKISWKKEYFLKTPVELRNFIYTDAHSPIINDYHIISSLFLQSLGQL